MEKSLVSRERFSEMPVVGIVRGISFDDMREILPLYLASGLRTIEITMNTAQADKIIRYAAGRFGEQLNIGAGTVCSPEDLTIALDAGAGFIVSPIVSEKVIGICRQHHVPVFPGAYTATEIYEAWSAGADMVKVFPSPTPSYIRDILAPFDQIKLLPTGGINYENCLDFLEAGAAGLGIGSHLFNKEHIRNKNWEALAGEFERFVHKITEYKRV
jgi:2-dehydro-3-deoxyphosphogluconate aldolase/(4S)-4-hydroxy-2-oxoglutarate aldolase